MAPVGSTPASVRGRTDDEPNRAPLMRGRLSAGIASLRMRLVLAVGAVVIVTVAVAFLVVYRQSGAQLRSQLNQSIRSNAAQLAEAVTQAPHASADQVLARARAYARSQPYANADVLLFAIVPGHGTASNHEELVSPEPAERGETQAEQGAENAQARALATPHLGYSSAMGPDVGVLAIFQQMVRLSGGLRLYAGAAEPLDQIDRAQDGIRRSFLLAGALALALAFAFAWLTGSRMSAPLRRVSQVATEVDEGDLTPRMALPPGANRELTILTDAFNHMLDRLANAFANQTAFIADASHELRTPLTVMRGQLELLASNPETDPVEVSRVSALLLAEISHLTRLTDDLLLLARSDSANFLHRETVALVPFVNDLWDGLSLTAERRFEVGPLVDVTLAADPGRLAQALRNLGANAIAHTAPPDGLVEISAALAPDRRHLTLTVCDDGPGIAPELRERVFERFFRTDPSRVRSSGGAGLGLAIVHAIVVAHGGRVRVSSAPTGGAAFTIDLPI